MEQERAMAEQTCPPCHEKGIENILSMSCAQTWGELDPVGGGGDSTCSHLGTPLHWRVAVAEERQRARPQLVQFAP